MGKKNTLYTYSNDNQTYTNMLCIQKEHIFNVYDTVFS